MFEKIRKRAVSFKGKAQVGYREVDRKIELERAKMKARELRRLKKQRVRQEARGKRAEMKNVELERIHTARVAQDRHKMLKLQERERRMKMQRRIQRSRRTGPQMAIFGGRVLNQPAPRRTVKKARSKQQHVIRGGVAYPVARPKKKTTRKKPTRRARPRKQTARKPQKTKWF